MRALRSADKKRNAENINIIQQICEIDQLCKSKQQQLYMNTMQSQIATRVNFSKKKQANESPFTLIQGINIPNQHGFLSQKRVLQNNNNANNQMQQSQSATKPSSKQKTLQAAQNTQQEVVIGENCFLNQSQILKNIEDENQISITPFVPNNYMTNDKQFLQESENNSSYNQINQFDSRPQTSSSSNTTNYTQKNDTAMHISTYCSEIPQYNIITQIPDDDLNNPNNNTLSASIIDLNNCFQDYSKQMSVSTNQKSVVGQNSFRAGKNQQETQEKIKRLRMRSHQSAMRGTTTSNSKKVNQIQNASGNNNFAKLLKMSGEEVKQKSKEAIESIKSKLAINSENDCVLVLKTQPQIYQDEDYLNNLSVYQPNQTACNFLSRKKNSCILNESSLPFKHIQNNCMNKTSISFMNNTHTNGFAVSAEKPAFSMGGVDSNKKNANQNIASLCITPNKSYQGKSHSKQLNRSIDNENGLKVDQRGSKINDENRNSLYKRMQNYNTFMRGKFAFHKLNKQKKELCNISNVLYNSLLENYEVEGMLKSFNPSLQNTQPKRRIYDADDDNENDSPDFNHMKKYYNKKYGLKIQQIENEKNDNQTGKYRSSHTNAHTPVKKNKLLKIKRATETNCTSQANSTNQYEKYYSQSATVNEENKFSKIYTENLLNQSCTDFLNICNLNDFSQMQEQMLDLDNDNTSSTQTSKRQQNMGSSYNLQNFSQFSSSVNNQYQNTKKQTSIGSKQKKKNEIDLVPWENEYNTKL